MYLKHFRLNEYPFSLTPDTEFWFDTPAQRDALNVICAALITGEGFVKVTADIGLGKTLVCHQLLRELDAGFQTVYLHDPQLPPAALRTTLAKELRLRVTRNCTELEIMQRIRNRLLKLAESGDRVALIIDEAQQMPDETLEALRQLTNLETEKFKLLQVVIVGQSELNERLDAHTFRQLRQRISFSCTLAPMDQAATGSYVSHRLAIAGSPVEDLFDGDAIRRVWAASGGTPRLINVLCNKALMAAFGRGDNKVTGIDVARAIDDTESIRSRRVGSAATRLRRFFRPGATASDRSTRQTELRA